MKAAAQATQRVVEVATAVVQGQQEYHHQREAYALPAMQPWQHRVRGCCCCRCKATQLRQPLQRGHLCGAVLGTQTMSIR
jgi:hypothetical protein